MSRMPRQDFPACLNSTRGGCQRVFDLFARNLRTQGCGSKSTGRGANHPVLMNERAVTDPGFSIWGVNPQGVRVPHFYLTNFSGKLHENEDILAKMIGTHSLCCLNWQASHTSFKAKTPTLIHRGYFKLILHSSICLALLSLVSLPKR